MYLPMFEFYEFFFLAKHLALHGCRSAYSSLEKSQIAAIPVMQGPDDDLESYDPNEVMAKAYMSKNKPVEEDSQRQTLGPLSKKRPMPDQDGPFAILGETYFGFFSSSNFEISEYLTTSFLLHCSIKKKFSI